ncbi:MAG: hypothetical protein ACRDP3_21210 [Streptomyces sp.]|uniref:hypothetical protein n=1 Tax=Streptomyces sp. TaxID=1931 RepID=UPI003D6B064B
MSNRTVPREQVAVPERSFPPAGLNSELTQAGVWWDAVRVPAYLGDRVLARLGEDCGAVIRDPYAHRLYWLIRTGAAKGWMFPAVAHVQILGAGSWLTVPPRDRVVSTGPHWARLAVGDRLLTDPELLHAALTAVIADALGPRGAVRR